MASSSSRRLTAEPTPTPAAPAARAMGTVTAERPEAQSTGTGTARLMAWAAASVGAAFSIRPRAPAARGRALVPPSVWIRSAPAATRSIASRSCASRGRVWGTVTDSTVSGRSSRVRRAELQHLGGTEHASLGIEAVVVADLHHRRSGGHRRREQLRIHGGNADRQIRCQGGHPTHQGRVAGDVHQVGPAGGRGLRHPLHAGGIEIVQAGDDLQQAALTDRLLQGGGQAGEAGHRRTGGFVA